MKRLPQKASESEVTPFTELPLSDLYAKLGENYIALINLQSQVDLLENDIRNLIQIINNKLVNE